MGTQETVRSAICGRNCATGDVVLSPQRLTAQGQRRAATMTNLRRIDRLAKEAIPKKSDRKATYFARKAFQSAATLGSPPGRRVASPPPVGRRCKEALGLPGLLVLNGCSIFSTAKRRPDARNRRLMPYGLHRSSVAWCYHLHGAGARDQHHVAHPEGLDHGLEGAPLRQKGLQAEAQSLGRVIAASSARYPTVLQSNRFRQRNAIATRIVLAFTSAFTLSR